MRGYLRKPGCHLITVCNQNRTRFCAELNGIEKHQCIKALLRYPANIAFRHGPSVNHYRGIGTLFQSLFKQISQTYTKSVITVIGVADTQETDPATQAFT